MRISCKYVGPLISPSGYGEANRTFVGALASVGVNVTTETLHYDNNRTNYFGKAYREIKDFEGRPINYDIKIVHIPCDSYVRHLEPCKYHIGHLFWETDRMDPAWVWNCNLMDEIWTGSQHNKDAFIRSGVKVPIYIFPETLDVNVEFTGPKWEVETQEQTMFLSVFQWIERKNPKVLVEAFLREFKKGEDVCLVLKTYKERFTDDERNDIVAQIIKWNREEWKTKNTAPIYVCVELMSKNELFRLYNSATCLVSPHRTEGWGRPTSEAMLMGVPVIATNSGGIHDWLPGETYYPLNYNEINVFNMEWAPWYNKDQKWADVDINELRKKMRQVVKDPVEAKAIGDRGKGYVSNNFSYEVVGRAMKGRLTDIQKDINKERSKGIKWLKR